MTVSFTWWVPWRDGSAGRSVHKGIDDLVNNLPILSASVSVYGCGNMSVRLRQTLRLFAKRSRASLSLRAQSRTTHLSHSSLTAHPILMRSNEAALGEAGGSG